MSNNDDFEFDDDLDFLRDSDDDGGFEDFDDFNDFDDFDGGGDDFADGFDDGDDFDDFDFDGGLGDDFGGGDDITFDPPADGVDGEGPSRGFVIIAGVLIVFMIVALGLIVVLLLGGGGENELDVTRTAIANANATVAEQANETATQIQADVFATETRMAITNTPSPSPTLAATETPTPDVAGTQTAEFEGTQMAANDALTATAVFLDGLLTPIVEATEDVQPPTATEASGGVVPDLSAIDMTATEIVRLFQATPTPVEDAGTGTGSGTGSTGDEPTAIPTLGGNGTGDTDSTGGGTGVVTGGSTGASLPDTGVFDDVVSGGPASVFLMAFGLLGVILVSRRLRSSNRKRR